MTFTTPVLPALTGYSLHPRHTLDLPVQTLSVPPLSLGLPSTPQSLRTFHLTLAPLARCLFMQGSSLCTAGTPVTPRTRCHFMMQARALRVPELCDDHTPPSCLVTNSLAKREYWSVNTLVLPDPWLTPGGPVTFLPIHSFRWTPLPQSQVSFCHLRSLRLPRSSPLLHFWSVASLLMLLRLWMPQRRLFHTAASRDVSTQLSFREFLASPSPLCSPPYV